MLKVELDPVSTNCKRRDSDYVSGKIPKDVRHWNSLITEMVVSLCHWRSSSRILTNKCWKCSV